MEGELMSEREWQEQRMEQLIETLALEDVMDRPRLLAELQRRIQWVLEHADGEGSREVGDV